MSAHQHNTTMIYTKEASLGEIETTDPVFNILRYTGESFSPNINMLGSDELRPDRRSTEERNVGEKPEGSFNYEFSADTFDDFLTSFLWADGTSDLSTGVTDGSTLHSFTFERGHTDLGPDKDQEGYFQWKGSVPNVFEISLPTESKVTGSMSFVVMEENTADVSIADGATPDPATTTKVINATTDVADLLVDGAEIDGFFTQEISMTIDNGTNGKTAVAKKGFAKIDPGQLSITGTLSGYLEDLNFYEKYKANGYMSIKFSLKDPDSTTKYSFELPKVQITNDAPDASQQGESVSEQIDFRALPGADGHMIKVTKTTS